ncbi:MAG: tetratricopeptide repeat protein [Phycisphaerales bacterium]|nr:MAG: tetratricopeptide repeat protein [Phycisphaerales bacterium]
MGAYHAGTKRSASGAERPGKSLLSECLLSDRGNMELNIPGHVLPDFLVEANSAVNSNRLTRAGELLNAQNIETACKIATENPSHADVIYLMLGIISQKLGRLKDALGWYKRILESQANALVANEIANIYRKIGRYSKVLEYRRRAMEIEPDDIGIWSNYAVDLIVLGRPSEGIDLMQRALQKNRAHSLIHSNLLWYTNYLPGHDARQLFEHCKRWGQTHAPPSLARTSHGNDPDPERRLRVGYICPDFRLHPTANTFHQFLDGHDREVVEVFGYGNVAKPDEVTEQLKQKFDHYRHVYGTSDEILVSLIDRDKIDILVVIGGRVANNRLMAMAYKPAPIQVDCGGINTTGMEQIDYRLTDCLLSPPGSEELFVEELVYLPSGLYCFRPPDYAPPVAPLPAGKNGHVTFGSFNGALKTNSYIVSIWSEVLKVNEGSRFLMKIGGGNDKLLRGYYLDLFEQNGIARERVEIHNWKPPIEHLQLYSEVDIVLDTFPVNGAMTMLEGLWMGVPAISLVGKCGFLSRTGLSILGRIGMEFFAVSTPDEFVAKATALARNLPALAKIRASMRQRLECSPLRDAKGFARDLEDAYRKMWHRWCRSQGVDVPSEKLDGDAEVCAGGVGTLHDGQTKTATDMRGRT